jgi:hypothetical protein
MNRRRATGLSECSAWATNSFPVPGEYLKHLRTAAGHAVKAVAFEKLVIEIQGLAAQAGFIQQIPDALPDRGGRERLADAVAGSLADAFDGSVGGVAIRQQEHLHPRVRIQNTLQQFHPVRQTRIYKNDVRMRAMREVPARFRIGGREQPDALRGQGGLDDLQAFGVVEDSENGWR